MGARSQVPPASPECFTRSECWQKAFRETLRSARTSRPACAGCSHPVTAPKAPASSRATASALNDGTHQYDIVLCFECNAFVVYDSDRQCYLHERFRCRRRSSEMGRRALAAPSGLPICRLELGSTARTPPLRGHVFDLGVVRRVRAGAADESACRRDTPLARRHEPDTRHDHGEHQSFDDQPDLQIVGNATHDYQRASSSPTPARMRRSPWRRGGPEFRLRSAPIGFTRTGFNRCVSCGHRRPRAVFKLTSVSVVVRAGRGIPHTATHKLRYRISGALVTVSFHNQMRRRLLTPPSFRTRRAPSERCRARPGSRSPAHRHRA